MHILFFSGARFVRPKCDDNYNNPYAPNAMIIDIIVGILPVLHSRVHHHDAWWGEGGVDGGERLKVVLLSSAISNGQANWQGTCQVPKNLNAPEILMLN